ncbi:MAG TPA: HAD family hydrolase [Candidatus Paceibacterota bacterium]
MKNKIKVIIFDLDDTLYDTSNRLPGKNSPNFADMKLLSGVRETLEQIKTKKILLTHGVKEIQEKKIDTLGIRGLFDEIIIVPSNTDKIPIFEKIAKEYPDPETVMAVGDRRDAEIRYGNMQGFVTVLASGFKYKNLLPQDDSDVPVHKIKSFRELGGIIASY